MDAKTVNIIAGATTSDNPKLAHTAIRFFLRTNEQLKAEVDEGDESDNEDHLKKTYERVRRAVWSRWVGVLQAAYSSCGVLQRPIFLNLPDAADARVQHPCQEDGQAATPVGARLEGSQARPAQARRVAAKLPLCGPAAH